jgi:predicted nucleic acid-binding protein
VIISGPVPKSVISKMFVSSVVLYELIAANIDQSTYEMYSSWKSAFGATNKLLTPTATDWFECSKLIRNMLRGQKSQTKGRTTRVTSAQQQQNDALIARTAWLHNCFVVTSNVRDFARFEPYMQGLVVIPTASFFDDQR